MRSKFNSTRGLTYSQANFIRDFRATSAVRDEVKPINVILPTQEPVQHPVIEITPEPTQEPKQEPTTTLTPTPKPSLEVLSKIPTVNTAENAIRTTDFKSKL